MTRSTPPYLAIDEAYRLHAPAVFRRARAILGSAIDAHEIVQEIFLSVLDEPEQFGGASSLTTWLYSATTHKCLNRIRDQKNRSRLVDVNVPSALSYLASDNPESSAVLRDVLEKLPEDLAAVAVYYYLDEMSYAEIANILGCSARHIGNLLDRLSERVESNEGERR